MRGIWTIVMRGISGVGKTVMSNLLKNALERLGKKVEVISKDAYRRYLNDREGYSYTKEEEQKVTSWYEKEYDRLSKAEKLDYIICDNTHTRQRELIIPCTPKGRVERIVVIQIGSCGSHTESTIPQEVIQRQRKELMDSEDFINALWMQNIIEIADVPPRSATPDNINAFVNDCENNNF